MSIFKKLALAWKGQAVVAQLSNITKGWKTLAFWIALLGSLGTYLGQLKGFMSPELSLIVGAALTALYNILRGVEKAQTDTDTAPWYKTSECLLGIGEQVKNSLMALQSGGIDPQAFAIALAVINGSMVAGRDFSHIEPSETLAKAEQKAQEKK